MKARIITKEPEPGETWVDEEGVEVIVCELGSFDRVRQDDGEYLDVFDPTQIGYWTATERNSTYYKDREEFLAEFKFVPAAQQMRDNVLGLITNELTFIAQETRLLEGDLKRLGTTGTASVGESTSTAVALTTEGGVEMADNMKKSVAKIRNQVQRNALRIKAETEKMAALMRMNVMAVKAKMEGIQAAAQAEADKLSKMVKAAEEVVWTFNLYLGKEETIERLRDGKPADRSEKIAIRQLVLFMDEESALFADEGGIDFKSMEEFDKWVLAKPEHLTQVLPNTRGIVAIKPRRKSKEYTGDPRVDAILNKMNHHTYFLIRNGEQVFRIDTDLEVSETLLPRATEFVELFEKTVTEWGRHGRNKEKKETIKPGDKEYMEAMERAGAKQRHYMRVFLFMQGLLDRTTVFHPFEVTRVNVFDMLRQDEHLEFVLDAETGRQLGDGRPSFSDWREKINDQLEVGMRVIGIFSTGEGSGRERESRTHPRWMDVPSSEELHTITSKGTSRYSGVQFHFRYPRTQEVYRRPRYGYDDDLDGAAKRRVSIYFEADDNNWIAFDLATQEEMEYYLRSRQNRYQYEIMFPVLKRAIQLKKDEAKAERPFRTALVGALMRDHALSEEGAVAAVQELVHWWKYKNKVHRALLSDDEKASRMILNEYILREKKATLRTEKKSKLLDTADLLLKLVPTAIALYHKAHNLFVVYRPENDHDVFAAEQLWRVPLRHGFGTAKLLSEKRWVVPQTSRLTRLELLEHRLRWNTWEFNADPKKHLTDEESHTVFDTGMAKIKADFDPAVRAKGDGEQWYDRGHSGVPVFFPIATYVTKEGWTHWFWSRKAKIPKVKKLTGEWGKSVLMKATIEWKRRTKLDAPGGVLHTEVRYNDEELRRSPFCPPADYDDFFGERDFPEPIWFDQFALDAFFADRQAYKAAHATLEPLHKIQADVVAQVKRAMKDIIAIEVRRKFDEDYGDEDLWEAHLATFKFPDFRPESLDRALPFILERGHPLVGMTVGSVFDMAKALGFSGVLVPDQWHAAKDTIYLPPLNYVIQPPSPIEDNDEGSEEEDE